MSPLENVAVGGSLPLTGKKVYSARVIAIYSILVNTPMGCILYGLNLCARGTKSSGRALLIGGIAGEIGLLWAVFLDRPFSSKPIYLVGILAAFCLYKFEKAPVQAALKQGAQLARWWPPALFAAMVVGVLMIVLSAIP